MNTAMNGPLYKVYSALQHFMEVTFFKISYWLNVLETKQCPCRHRSNAECSLFKQEVKLVQREEERRQRYTQNFSKTVSQGFFFRYPISSETFAIFVLV